MCVCHSKFFSGRGGKLLISKRAKETFNYQRKQQQNYYAFEWQAEMKLRGHFVFSSEAANKLITIAISLAATASFYTDVGVV